MSEYYDRDGSPITVDEWMLAMKGTPDPRRVALTDVTDDVQVSTVWLGIDHDWDRGKPLIFETMIFGGPLDQEQERYSTEAQARAGHDAMVKRATMARHAEFGEVSP